MQNKYSEAERYFGIVIERAPDSIKVDSYRGLAETRIRKGDFEHAILYLNKAFSISKTSPLIYCSFGNFHFEKNEFQKVIEYFGKALQLDSMQYEARLFRAKAYFELDDFLNAEKDYEFIRKRFETLEPEVLLELAQSRFHARNYELALKTIGWIKNLAEDG